MQRINRAKDEGDIVTLREIAADPNGYLMKNGEPGLDFSESVKIATLLRLHESLQAAILTAMDDLSRLRESPEYELYQIHQEHPETIPEIAQTYEKYLADEISQLEHKLDTVNREISRLKE
jgi:DNA polymerase-3 subunit epsilon